MAYDITLEQSAPNSFVGGKKVRATDVSNTTATVTTLDMGSAAFKHVRGKVHFSTNSGTAFFRVKVNTTTDTTGDELLYVSPTVGAAGFLVPVTLEFNASGLGTAFRYVKIDVVGQTTSTMDAVAFAA